MMSRWLFCLFLCCVLVIIKADTKILREVDIFDDGSHRQETFSLKNENTPEEELIIEGTHTQSISNKDDTNFVYNIETVYVADKDGYRVKYKLVREPALQIPVLQLSPSTLKSVTG